MAARILVEICVASVEGAVAAEGAGADRIELNAGLEVGGLTPSIGLLREVRRAVSLPTIVMIRPRAGGFCYSEAEFQIMRWDIDSALEAGADGIAFGVLGADGTVDMARCEQLLRQVDSGRARQCIVVFHRAFDFVPDPVAALDQITELGVRRVMTSGRSRTALEGASLIAELLTRSRGRIEILAAGGIRAGNVREVLARTGCDQVHASCSENRSDPSIATGPPLGLPHTDPARYVATDASQVRDLIEVVREMR